MTDYRIGVPIDLNSDIGEGIGEDPDALDAALLDVVTSVNVACGGHAGDVESMGRVAQLASERKVAIGAHISYQDREGFGRQPVDIDNSALAETLYNQIWSLETQAAKVNSAVTYVKPHGYLYLAPAGVDGHAHAVIEVVQKFSEETGRNLPVLGLPGSPLLTLAKEAGVKGVPEAFADRSYTSTGTLVPRSEPGAVVNEPNEALSRLRRLLRDNEILSIDGEPIDVRARSICVHGDTPGAVVIARRLRAAIDADRVRIAAFAPPPNHED